MEFIYYKLHFHLPLFPLLLYYSIYCIYTKFVWFYEINPIHNRTYRKHIEKKNEIIADNVFVFFFLAHINYTAGLLLSWKAPEVFFFLKQCHFVDLFFVEREFYYFDFYVFGLDTASLFRRHFIRNLTIDFAIFFDDGLIN